MAKKKTKVGGDDMAKKKTKVGGDAGVEGGETVTSDLPVQTEASPAKNAAEPPKPTESIFTGLVKSLRVGIDLLERASRTITSKEDNGWRVGINEVMGTTLRLVGSIEESEDPSRYEANARKTLAEVRFTLKSLTNQAFAHLKPEIDTWLRGLPQ